MPAARTTFSEPARLPRYTSYPTAADMTDDFSCEQALRSLHESNGDLIPADLALYIHIPYCRQLCWYCGCNRTVTQRDEPVRRYVDLLKQEIRWLARHVDRDRTVRLLQIGGGTPNVLSQIQLSQLLHTLRSVFRFTGGLDAGIELDPRQCDSQQLAALREMGFARVSFGVQDLNLDVQRAINRVQPAGLVLPLIEEARRLGFESINVDLVHGLPAQTETGICETVATLAASGVDRWALFEYAHLPEMFRAQRMLESSGVPGPAQSLQLRQAAAEAIGSFGYHRIGLDHFARSGDSLLTARERGVLRRGFQGYFAGAGLDLLGLGVSAISEFGDVLVQNGKSMHRYRGCIEKSAPAWQRACFKQTEDHLRGDWIEQLMCYGRVERDRLPGYRGAYSQQLWIELMAVLAQRFSGIVQIHGDRLQVPEHHWDRLRELAVCFDARRTPGLSQVPRIQ